VPHLSSASTSSLDRALARGVELSEVTTQIQERLAIAHRVSVACCSVGSAPESCSSYVQRVQVIPTHGSARGVFPGYEVVEALCDHRPIVRVGAAALALDVLIDSARVVQSARCSVVLVERPRNREPDGASAVRNCCRPGLHISAMSMLKFIRLYEPGVTPPADEIHTQEANRATPIHVRLRTRLGEVDLVVIGRKLARAECIARRMGYDQDVLDVVRRAQDRAVGIPRPAVLRRDPVDSQLLPIGMHVRGQARRCRERSPIGNRRP